MYCKVNSCIQSILPKKAIYFKEELLDDVLVVPSQKPDMERILDIVAWAEVEDYKLIETEVGYSHEGQRLTGKKLVTEIKIKEKLTYVADVPEQSGHAAHYEKLKSIFVILPEMVGAYLQILPQSDTITLGGGGVNGWFMFDFVIPVKRD